LNKKKNTHLNEGASTFDEAETAEEDGDDNEETAAAVIPANEVESE